ncbi:heterokaryon incompatibility protein-domain-containing protein [Aspergillus carlsbadensis]|nr:heterokaryon incompatibility protein-domain-containing protein [Aspergillus carlsbadensis]
MLPAIPGACRRSASIRVVCGTAIRARGYTIPTRTHAASTEGKPTETSTSQAKDEANDEKIANRLLTAIAISSVIGLGVLGWGSYKLYTNREKPISLIVSAYRAWDESRFRPVYAPLRREDEIRLLVLEPGTGKDPIRCRLEHAVLSEKPDYEALSYVWGDPTKIDYITCDDATVRVRESIFGALHALRRPGEERILWVDVLCINQPDSVEKGRQVELMGEIYAGSRQVLVWLGISTPATENALGTIAKADECLKRTSWIYRWHPYSFAVLQSRGWTRLSQQQWAELQDYDWASVLTLLQHPWSRRVWTVQELIKAPKAIIVHGTQTLPADVFFFPIINIISSIYEEQLVPHIRKSNVSPKFIHSFGWRGLGCLGSIQDDNLLSLVVRFGAAGGASDPRDKIYSCRSIAGDCGKSDWEVFPDYDASTVEVYSRFARWCLLSRRQMQVLSYAGLRDDTDPDGPRIAEDLPTWVVDWSSVSAQVLNATLATIRADYNASAGSEPSLIWAPNQPRLLRIKGRIVDTLDTLAVSRMDLQMHYILNQKVHGRLNQILWSKAFQKSLEAQGISRDMIDRVAYAQLAIEHFGSSNCPEDLLQEIVWMDSCKDIAFPDPSRVTRARTNAFSTTMARNRSWNGDSGLPGSFAKSFAWYVDLLEQVRDGEKTVRTLPRSFAAMHGDRLFGMDNELLELLDKTEREMIDMLDKYWMRLHSQHFCRTREDRLGWVPTRARSGDLVCIFDGARVPYVIRPRVVDGIENLSILSLAYWRHRASRWLSDERKGPADTEYTLVGECYIQGLMEGEAKDHRGLVSRYFTLC